MKKIILLLLLLPMIALSQKIKTKKDKVLVDEKEVAILNDKISDQYELSDLNNIKQLTIEYEAMAVGQTIMSQWLVVTSGDGTKKTEIPYDVLITSFSPTKIILHLLSVKYGLFDSNGFNQNKITEFFATQRESISDKAFKTKVDVLESRKERQEKISRYNPYVKNDGTVMFGGTAGTSIVGRVVGSSYTPMGSSNFANVYDLDNNKVASAQIKGNFDNDIEVTLYTDSKFTYQSTSRFSGPDDVAFFKELIEELVYRDITLEHQAKTYNANLLNEKIRIAKERSVNVYNVKGYAIDNKGVKYDGILTAQFEKLDINQTGNTEVIDAIDKYGKFVTVKYLNEKGKERIITLAAKDNTVFYVKNADGSETGYRGMKVKGDVMKKLSNAMSLGFNNAYFYRVVFSEKDNSLLVDPVEKDRYVINTKNQEAGQMIDKRNNKNISIELAEYLSSCKDLSNEIKKEVFDLKIEENLINIVKEYNECKYPN